jgi:propanediol dehydratase small subunit
VRGGLKMKDVDRAKERLDKEYERAVKIAIVDDPLCFALYRTWRYYDSMRKKRKEKTDDETDIHQA